MSKAQFIQAVNTDGLELAMMYAEMALISKTQVDLWLVQSGVQA